MLGGMACKEYDVVYDGALDEFVDDTRINALDLTVFVGVLDILPRGTDVDGLPVTGLANILQFNNACKHILFFPVVHSLADAHKHIPGGFIGNIQLTGQGACRDPTLVGCYKIDSLKPSCQRLMCPVHDLYLLYSQSVHANANYTYLYYFSMSG